MTIELLIITTVMMVLLMTWLCLENEVVALILLSKGSIFAFPPVIAKNINIHIKILNIYRVSQKTHFQNAVGATVHCSRHPLCLEIYFLVVSY